MHHDPSGISVAVVGAGISGLVAARQLQDTGYDVRVFDKARGPGGRMSTRRQDGYEFDHGAQYFTVRDESFREAVGHWRDRGMVEVWPGRIVKLADGNVQVEHEPVERFVAVPRMNALCHDLSGSLTVEFNSPVSRILRAEGAWALSLEDGRQLGHFNLVIVTTPPAQLAPLLAEAPNLAKGVAPAEMLPCWAVMVVFERGLEIEWDGAFVSGSCLSWVARNSSKPGRTGGESWVLHASPEWSEAHIEANPIGVGDELITAFFEETGVRRPESVLRSVHRWRYAKTRTPLAAEYLYDVELGLGVCGDWCRGDRVEDAFLSGLALARRIGAA
jgi:predicted NAD/FAD-dependent oxidoreductase